MEQSSLREAFREEAADYLDVLGQEVTSLERDFLNRTALRRTFIAAHSLKASAAIADFERVRVLAHAVEDVLAAVEARPRAFSADAAGLLHAAVEALRALVANDDPSRAPTPETNGLIASLRALADQISEATGTTIPSAQQQETRTAQPNGRKKRGAIRRALVLEDSPTVRLLETMLLNDEGFSVDAFEDPQAALGRLCEDRYDLVVTGMETRGLNGLDFVAAIRAHGLGSLRVIMTDPEEDPRQKQRARDLGVAALVPTSSLRHHHISKAVRKVMRAP